MQIPQTVREVIEKGLLACNTDPRKSARHNVCADRQSRARRYGPLRPEYARRSSLSGRRFGLPSLIAMSLT